MTGGYVRVVDEASGENPPRRTAITSDSLDLTAFAVAVVTLPASSTNMKEGPKIMISSE